MVVAQPQTVDYDIAIETNEPLVSTTTLCVNNLTYTVAAKVGPWWKGACLRKTVTLKILDNVTMLFKRGQITAILGNSGSGKTSLLDVIACRATGTIKGDVTFNNYKCTQALIRQRATYVMQADRLLPNLTVRETLRYTALLQYPQRFTATDLNRKVNKVIQEMGLKDVADARVGGSVVRGISGGEKRRLTIAIQLLSDPDIILLDEPTSGLDSYTARYIVRNLRDMAHRGKIVLLTVHQPSSDIFPMFDQIGILSVGRVVYLGPSRDMVTHFTDLGYPCDKYTNPLDKYVDVASIDRRDLDKYRESFKRVSALVESYNISKTYQTIQFETSRATNSKCESGKNGWKKKTEGPNWFALVWTLCCRMHKNLMRDRLNFVSRIFLFPFFIVFVLLFLGHLKHDQGSIQDRIGLLYQALTVPTFMAMINALALFPSLRDLYYRECRDGLYSTPTFLIAYCVHILPYHIVSSLMFGSLVYWLTGLYPEVHRFGYFMAVVYLSHYAGEMMVVAMMGVFNTVALANSTTALIQSCAVLIGSGFLKTTASLLEPFKWLTWVTIYKYSAEILVFNEFKDLEFTCDIGVNKSAVCMPDGNTYLQIYFPDAEENLARNFGAVAAYAFGTLILAITIFKAKGVRNLH